MSFVTFAKRVGDSLDWTSKRQITEFLKENENYKGEYVVTITRFKKKRTLPQNNALHKFFDLLATALNEKGLTMQIVLSKVVDLDWNGKTIKEIVWKPIQKALTGKESTADLDNTSEINTIYDHINRHMGQEFGVHIPFPVKEEEFDIPVAYPKEELTPKF